MENQSNASPLTAARTSFSVNTVWVVTQTRGRHDLCFSPPRWRLSLPPCTSRPAELWQTSILYSELDGALGHLFQLVETNTLSLSGTAAARGDAARDWRLKPSRLNSVTRCSSDCFTFAVQQRSLGITLSAGQKMLTSGTHPHIPHQQRKSSWCPLAVWKWNSLQSACRTQCAEISMCEWKCVLPSNAVWILSYVAFSFFFLPLQD